MPQTETRRRSLADTVLDAIFPPQCVTCRRWGVFLCDECREEMAPASEPRCRVCWQPAESPCAVCLERPPFFDAVRAAYAFGGPARDLVHALKYRGVTAVAPLMADAMAKRIAEWPISPGAIVPVPMATWRKRRRGFNQAERLARLLSEKMGVPLRNDLLGRRAGASQVQQPSREARRANADGAYVSRGQAVDGDMLLIDDVMTTGATLDACARILRQCGATRVFGLTFAREA